MRAGAAAWVLLLVAACRSAAATPATDAQTSCPATRPDPAAAPPAWIARDAGAGPGTGWLLHGDGAQWVRLPADGRLTTYYDPGLPPERREISMKFLWYRVAEGRLLVEGRRLDAPAPPLQARVPDGYGPTGFQATGLVFPTPGCWEVTGRVGDDALRFVLWVRPPIPIEAPAPTFAAAAPTDTPAPAAETVCRVTLPNGKAPPYALAGAVDHGNDAGTLFTGLSSDGRVVFSPYGPGQRYGDGSLGMKWPWFKTVFGEGVITGRRLDGPGPPLPPITLAYAPGFYPTDLRFPSAGCWEVTATVDRARRIGVPEDAIETARLTFVTLVEKVPVDPPA